MLSLAQVAGCGKRYKVVIAIMNGIGDGFLALPLIRHVFDLFGRDSVTVWGCQCYSNTVFAELGSVFLPTIAAHRPVVGDAPHDLANILMRLQGGTEEVCWISLNSYPLEAEEYVIQKLQPEFVFGFKDIQMWPQRPDANLLHRADQYFRVIGESSMPSQAKRRQSISIAALRIGQQFRREADWEAKRLIAIHGRTAPRKQWPMHNWSRLIQALAPRARIVPLGGALHIPNKNLLTVPPTGWEMQVAILANAHLFVGIDSSFAHVADAHGIPGVVLFGPTSPHVKRWGPRSVGLVALLSPDGDFMRMEPEHVLHTLQTQLLYDS